MLTSPMRQVPTPLRKAVQKSRVDVVAAMTEHGADPERDAGTCGRPPLV